MGQGLVAQAIGVSEASRDSARYSRLHEVFEGARQLDGEERASFLSAACGSDAELEREVRELLDVQARTFDHDPFSEGEVKNFVRFCFCKRDQVLDAAVQKLKCFFG